jgi:hypothetical protein
MYMLGCHSIGGTRLLSNPVPTLRAKPQVVGPTAMTPGKPSAVVPQ